MAIVEIMETKSKDKHVSEDKSIPKDAKKSGPYLYVDTEYEGIKKIVSKQGGYLVFLDYGRRYKVDKKTGALVLRQEKTSKRVNTESEAKRLRREAEAIRNGEIEQIGKPRTVLFKDAIDEFKESERYIGLSDGYKHHGDNYLKHAVKYFANKEPCKISVVDMEGYLRFLLEKGRVKPNKDGEEGLSLYSVDKNKVFLKIVWKYFIDSKKYGVKDNVADLAAMPLVELNIDGKIKMVTKITYHPRPYTIEELNYTLNDIVQNEFDRSLLVAVGLAAIGSLRHSETIGLRLGKFYHNELMKITDDACDYGGFDKEYYEEHDNLMFIDTAIMNIRNKNVERLPKANIIRVSAVPECLKRIIEYAMEQRKEINDIYGKEFSSEDSLYQPLVNLITGNVMKCSKLGRKWREYQRRRTKRMKKAGLEPLEEIRYHDLRHTHSNLLKRTVPSWEISNNMGHVIPDANTTQKVYWSDRQPFRDDIIRFFDENIKIDWDKALDIHINGDKSRVKVNGSGHLVITKEEEGRRKKRKRKFVFKEEEIEKLFLPIEYEDNSEEDANEEKEEKENGLSDELIEQQLEELDSIDD